MVHYLAAISDYISGWQWLLIILLIGLIVAFFVIRKRQNR